MDRRIMLTIAMVSICLISVYIFTSQPVNAQLPISAVINTDGSVTGTSLIERNEDVYTLTGNISGRLQIQKTGITVDGAGFALIGDGIGRGIDLSIISGELPVFRSVENVTVRNLIIVDFTYGVYIANAGQNIFYSNTVTDCERGFWISGESDNDIFYNTIQDNVDGISFNFATGPAIISHNNMINNRINVWQSTQPNVDMNYWNDYITEYPNAVEIGNSGIGNTPYVYNSINNFTDSHPLMRFISTSDIEFPTVTATPTTAPTATVPIGQGPIGAPLDQIIYGYIMAGGALAAIGFSLILVLVLMKRNRSKLNSKLDAK